MDKYTSVVLTVIAVCLIGIVIKLWEPTPAYSGFLGDTVRNFLSYPTTYGDLLNLKNLKGEDRKIERNRIIRNMPLVRVYKVDNTVDVNVQQDVVQMQPESPKIRSSKDLQEFMESYYD